MCVSKLKPHWIMIFKNYLLFLWRPTSFTGNLAYICMVEKLERGKQRVKWIVDRKKELQYLNDMFIPIHVKQIMAHSIIGPFVYDRSDLQLHLTRYRNQYRSDLRGIL